MSELKELDAEPAKPNRTRMAIGWAAVAGSILISSGFAFWGINENFHEGWYHHHLGNNLAMMFGQYLSPVLLFVVAALLAIRWRWVGVGFHLFGAAFVIWFFWGVHPQVLATFYVPLISLALAYAIGTPQPRRRAFALIVVVPLLVTIGFGVEPAIRVAGRIDDMNRGERRITSNGVDLVWAPQGPGWPAKHDGTTWEEAMHICRHLSEDGTTVMPTPQDIWRLPTVAEFVRSQHRSGANCGGTWDAESARPTYERRPDKESPLWATDSNVIYWWVGTPVDAEHAYKATYNGNVRPATKSSSFPYWGFRAVREVRPDDPLHQTISPGDTRSEIFSTLAMRPSEIRTTRSAMLAIAALCVITAVSVPSS